MSQGALTFVSPRPQLPTLRSTPGTGPHLKPEHAGPALGPGDLPVGPQASGTALTSPCPPALSGFLQSSRLSVLYPSPARACWVPTRQTTCVRLWHRSVKPQPGSRASPRLPHSQS